MSNISGFDNEYEFVKMINGKKIEELNVDLRGLLNYLYPHISNDTIITCFRNHYAQKSDILLRIDGVIKGVSIKKGSKNSVHVDRLSDFIHF